MATNIPNEILQAIFKFVDGKDERDYGTLFNCALVNRQWCNNAIPILWHDPFYRETNDSVIKTLMSFLDNDQLQQLDKIRHRLPLIENKKFDYPSFIRCINLNMLWESLYVLYSPASLEAQDTENTANNGNNGNNGTNGNNGSDGNNESSGNNENTANTAATTTNSTSVQHPSDPDLFEDIKLTLTVLLKMLAQKITNVRRFKINLKLHSSNVEETQKGEIKNKILELLLEPEISDLLRFTTELQWFQTKPYKGYMPQLAGICSNLEKLIISLGNFDESQTDDATAFIKAQTHLRELEIFNCSSGIQKLISFSRDQVLSIQVLILYHVDFYGCGPLISLTKCENLRHLSFRYCTYIQKEMCNPLFSANFPKLKKVEAPFTSCPVLEEWAKNYSK
ncbi:lon-domain-containing protein [Gigaspora margarita]|uniref:Lon-domain-containing protein n=1 Tax=Gigaspora margarita TaxID=4874 RepID=A0A8H4EHW1_GIGMA|nr:lon-domain-containing protein [Gigaspora margarita]